MSYALTAASIAALIVTFSYLGALLLDRTHVSTSALPIYLLLSGAGAVAGIAIGGRAADRRPLLTLAVAFVGVLVVSLLLAALARSAPSVAVLVVLLGAFGFDSNPVLNSRVFGLAPGAPTLAPAFNVSAFNVGISAGPWLGGAVLTSGAGFAAIPAVGAALAAFALGLLGVETRMAR